MRVLVACEFSGTVRDAFSARGHEAMSCDLLPSEKAGNHFQGDIRELLKQDKAFDLMISHPPCTYLASSGLHWNTWKPGHKTHGDREFAENRQRLTEEALEFVRFLLNQPIPMIALENPAAGRISTKIRKPDQVIHPWQFGHNDSKGTGLWLKGLPKLQPTEIIPAPAWIRCECCDGFLCTIHGYHVYDCKCPPIDTWAKRGIDPHTLGGRRDNQTPSGQNKLGPSDDRWKKRSITYPGIAKAMAEQWGEKR